MPRAPRHVVELLQDLIAIPSVNPAGDPGHEKPGEKAIAEYVAHFLRKIGASVRLKEILPGRPNVVGMFASRGKKRILLAPHLDTVSVRGMTINPFDPVLRQGRIYGRGASDTKGSMAAMLWALKEWSESSARTHAPIEITFAGLMGEEAGNQGAEALANSSFRADFAVIGEPTEMKIVHAHKGAAWMTIETFGKSCHGSTPEKGENAILRMKSVIDQIETKILPRFAKIRHPLLASPTLNLGIIRGGSKTNIVPDHCLIECDIRTVPGFSAKQVTALFKTILKPMGAAVKWHIDRSPDPLYTDPKNRWVQSLQSYTRGLATATWFCDAALFSKVGTPSIAIGPGSIAQAHTADEFLKIADLEDGTRRFSRWLQSFSKA